LVIVGPPCQRHDRISGFFDGFSTRRRSRRRPARRSSLTSPSTARRRCGPTTVSRWARICSRRLNLVGGFGWLG